MLAIHGETLRWSQDTHLLAGIFDHLAAANWQRSAKPGLKKPVPLERPGQPKPPTRDEQMGKPVPFDVARKILDNWSN